MYWNDEFALEEYNSNAWSIWRELSDTVGLWKETYGEYWGFDGGEGSKNLSAEDRASREQHHQTADIILEMTFSLTLNRNRSNPVSLTESQVRATRDLLNAYKDSPIVRDRVALSLAKQFTARIAKAEERAFRLIDLLLGRPLNDRAASYISRATNLYVEGSQVETLIMCRAALEAALVDALGDRINQDKKTPPLGQLIKEAGKAGLLDGSGVSKSLRVKSAGDFVVHHFPGIAQEDGQIEDAFEAIRDLSIVLRELFPDPTFE